MTDTERETLTQLEQQASPGPWTLIGDFIYDGENLPVGGYRPDLQEAALIVAMRNALPDLLRDAEAYRRLKAQVRMDWHLDEQETPLSAEDRRALEADFQAWDSARQQRERDAALGAQVRKMRPKIDATRALEGNDYFEDSYALLRELAALIDQETT